jgi:RND family efflux transporter MFP subunit
VNIFSLRRQITALTLCWVSLTAMAETLSISPAQQKALGIVTHTVTDQAPAMSRQWSGRVSFAPDAEWMVTASLPGTISRWLVTQGQVVKRGDILALLQSDAALDLQRDYLAASTQLAVDTAAQKRDETLFDSGIIAEKRLLETRQRQIAQQAVLNSLQQRLQIAGFTAADLSQLKTSGQLRADYPLRAPADGVVAERIGAIGTRIEAMTSLLRIGDTSRPCVFFRVPATDITAIKTGEAIITDNGARGSVRQISRVIDPATQAVDVVAQLDDDNVIIGSLVQVRSAGATTGMRLPAGAIIQHAGKDVVFVAAPTGFEVREVRVRSGGDKYVIVLDGLHTGERVAISGLAALKGKLLGLGEDL